MNTTYSRITRASLEQKLEEISGITMSKFQHEDNVGVLDGTSGLALFHFYYARYLDDDFHSEIGAEMIEHCLDKINQGYAYPTYCSGIAGLGWAIQHLVAHDFLDSDSNELLNTFDRLLYAQMKYDFSVGHFDLLHGAMGYGYYFMNRAKHAPNENLKEQFRNYLYECVGELYKLALIKDTKATWKSLIDPTTNAYGHSFGLSHGIPSILNFLARTVEVIEPDDRCKNMIQFGLNNLLFYQNLDNENLSLFPDKVAENEAPKYNSRLAWCYGDLGVAVTLLRLSDLLQDNSLRKMAIHIFNRASRRRTPEETYIIDAGFCHGSFGVAQMFRAMNYMINDHSFEDTVDFWIKDGMQKAVYEDGYAGFKQLKGQALISHPTVSVLEGIAGIGLVIIDYLSPQRSTWDECLLIS